MAEPDAPLIDLDPDHPDPRFHGWTSVARVSTPRSDPIRRSAVAIQYTPTPSQTRPGSPSSHGATCSFFGGADTNIPKGITTPAPHKSKMEPSTTVDDLESASAHAPAPAEKEGLPSLVAAHDDIIRHVHRLGALTRTDGKAPSSSSGLTSYASAESLLSVTCFEQTRTRDQPRYGGGVERGAVAEEQPSQDRRWWGPASARGQARDEPLSEVGEPQDQVVVHQPGQEVDDRRLLQAAGKQPDDGSGPGVDQPRRLLVADSQPPCDRGNNRPVIHFRRVPADVSIQTLFSTIRVPHGRILHAEFLDDESAARVVFAEVSAHNMLLEMAFQGCFPVPWANPVCLSVSGGETMTISEEERLPTVTRVLCIHGLRPAHRALSAVLGHLDIASHGWLYAIEKVLLMHAGRLDGAGPGAGAGPGDDPFVQINFSNIADALHARRVLQDAKDAELAAIYRPVRFFFGHDECSTTGAPLAIRAVLDVRGGAHAGPRGDIDARGYVLLPQQLSFRVRWRETKARVLAGSIGQLPGVTATTVQPQPSASGPAPEARVVQAPAKWPAKMPKPPFDYVQHGILVTQIPASTKESDVLAAISGGKVRRVHIFRAGRELQGTASHAAVFFMSAEIADRVRRHTLSRNGLRLPSTGRRYHTERYLPPADCEAREEGDIPKLATRILSLTVEVREENQRITCEFVSEAILERAKMAIPLTEITSESRTKRANSGANIPLKCFRVQLTSIQAASVCMIALKQIPVAGPTHITQYERDPCDGPVERMT